MHTKNVENNKVEVKKQVKKRDPEKATLAPRNAFRNAPKFKSEAPKIVSKIAIKSDPKKPP